MSPPPIPPQPFEKPTDALTRHAERYISARRSRTTPVRAKALLMRFGTANELRDDDRLDASDEV